MACWCCEEQRTEYEYQLLHKGEELLPDLWSDEKPDWDEDLSPDDTQTLYRRQRLVSEWTEGEILDSRPRGM